MFFSSKFFQCKTFYNFLQYIKCSIPARQIFTHTPDLMLQSCLGSPCSSWIQSEEGFCKEYNNRPKVFTQEILLINTSKSEYFYMDIEVYVSVKIQWDCREYKKVLLQLIQSNSLQQNISSKKNQTVCTAIHNAWYHVDEWIFLTD